MASESPATTPEQPDGPDSPTPYEPLLFVVLECDRPLAGGARYSLTSIDRVVVGRGTERTVTHHDRDLDLRIPSQLLSTNHIAIARDGEGWLVQDLDSRNGTFLNRRKVTREQLRDGDLLELGRVVMRFRVLPTSPARAATYAPVGFATLVPSIATDLEELARIAASPLPILLLGETGTGKELIARGIHELSGRSGPLVPVNCGALSSTLLDSQLFGHIRGSFTGALRDEPGFVRSSDGGTLFLDEIGDLPAAAQAALLRVLQEREVVPVGGTRAVPIDLRIVAATHRQLDLLAARGDFRSDLYARLSGHVHYLAPLRERREDLGVIVADLLQRGAPNHGANLRFTADAARELATSDWPLNIRQLEQSLARAVTLADDGLIHARHLAVPQRGAVEDRSAPIPIDDAARRDELHGLLARHKGNISEISRVMGCSRMQIHRWMQRYGFDAESFRR
ncbi:MAG: sigma 54-interacting transcriptional regulator [Kofleriaceae bacterium]